MKRDTSFVSLSDLRLQLRADPYQTAVRLHDEEGWTYGEIAYKLDCKVGTVKSWVSRGRKMHSDTAPDSDVELNEESQ